MYGLLRLKLTDGSNAMSRRRLPLLIVIPMGLMLWGPVVADAGLISDGFTGYYAIEPVVGNSYGNWTLDGQGDYRVEPAPNNSIRLVLGQEEFSLLEFRIVIPAQGTLEFDYSPISEGSVFEYLLNDKAAFVPPPRVAIPVQAGDSFMFRFYGNGDAPGYAVEISNFGGPLPDPIPEPSTLALLGLGMACLARRQIWLHRKARVGLASDQLRQV
jgi:hypothetical protein